MPSHGWVVGHSHVLASACWPDGHCFRLDAPASCGPIVLAIWATLCLSCRSARCRFRTQHPRSGKSVSAHFVLVGTLSLTSRAREESPIHCVLMSPPTKSSDLKQTLGAKRQSSL